MLHIKCINVSHVASLYWLQALKYFLDAEETKPGFYTGNWLYLARTYYQLGKYGEAKDWLKKLLEYSPKNVEDEEVSLPLHISTHHSTDLVCSIWQKARNFRKSYNSVNL